LSVPLVISNVIWLLKLSSNQNLIRIYFKFSNNFKKHFILKKTKPFVLALLSANSRLLLEKLILPATLNANHPLIPLLFSYVLYWFPTRIKMHIFRKWVVDVLLLVRKINCPIRKRGPDHVTCFYDFFWVGVECVWTVYQVWIERVNSVL